ncbi:MAG TPA: flagellar basal body L-ring protein FlgH [Steroidobacteraceae bacterium]|nr:flagellar basal body L-ring protein FlgH [Steroidobacteraceae bacterium]
MKNNTLFLAMAVACAVILLAGCAAMPPHVDDYSAVLPENVVAASQDGGSIYHTGYDVPLFENPVAHRIGDVITVTLAEKTEANKSAATNTKKNSTVALPGITVAGAGLTFHSRDLTSASIDNNSGFAGEGDSSQKNELTGNISVTIANRLSNGNLVVRGQKWITLNQGREYIRLQGIVRPLDIAPDNSIPSYKVADANIEYGGSGTLADSNTKSWLARFFDSKWFPF